MKSILLLTTYELLQYKAVHKTGGTLSLDNQIFQTFYLDILQRKHAYLLVHDTRYNFLTKTIEMNPKKKKKTEELIYIIKDIFVEMIQSPDRV